VRKWAKTDLLWWAEDRLIPAFVDASARWTSVCALNLRQTDDASEADIVATFADIDGSSGTLAYAYFPGVPGRKPDPIHGDVFVEPADFDPAPHEGRVEIIAHELGHSIGIEHHEAASKRHTLMAPYYNGPRNGKLFPEDIKAAQRLYPLSR